MYQDVKCTCKVIVFAHCVVAFSLPSPSSLLKLPIHHLFGGRGRFISPFILFKTVATHI